MQRNIWKRVAQKGEKAMWLLCLLFVGFFLFSAFGLPVWIAIQTAKGESIDPWAVQLSRDALDHLDRTRYALIWFYLALPIGTSIVARSKR